jgi:hypothetical protein
MIRYLPFTIALIIGVAGCHKPKTGATTNPDAKIDPCSLITADEVLKIQGSSVKEVKPSETSDASFRFSQCFYTTEIFNESVSLAVTQRNSAGDKPKDPKEFWKDSFGKYASTVQEREGDEEKKKSLAEEDEDRAAKPKKVEGLGDDAWWTASRMGGAVYVLKDNVFIRVSVGGTGNEESKMEKAKALATKALSRL